MPRLTGSPPADDFGAWFPGQLSGKCLGPVEQDRRAKGSKSLGRLPSQLAGRDTVARDSERASPFESVPGQEVGGYKKTERQNLQIAQG